MTSSSGRAPRGVLVCFLLSMLGAAAFAAGYVLGWGTPAYGASLGWACLFLAIGLGRWSQLVDLDEPDYVEERAVGPTPEVQFDRFVSTLTEQRVPRSGLLWGMFGATVGTLGLAGLFPLRSLFPQTAGQPDPHELLTSGPWTKGQSVVTEDGLGVRPDDMVDGSVMTVFPEGYDVRQAPGATLLIRLAADDLPTERTGWAVDGVVAFSKLCTHAGCPVGLYADESAQLLCPCHHSIFDVREGCRPVEGPAAHPLPQLPLALDADGYLVADGDFSGPVGASWWEW